MREFVYLYIKDTFTCPLCRDKRRKYASMPVASHKHLSILHQLIGKKVMPVASMLQRIELKLPRSIYKTTCSSLRDFPRLQHNREYLFMHVINIQNCVSEYLSFVLVSINNTFCQFLRGRWYLLIKNKHSYLE